LLSKSVPVSGPKLSPATASVPTHKKTGYLPPKRDFKALKTVSSALFDGLLGMVYCMKYIIHLKFLNKRLQKLKLCDRLK